MSRTILIMAGGTGGHIFPALAVAEQLQRLDWTVVWLGVPGSMEADLVPRHGYAIRWVNFSGVRRNGWLRKLLLPFNLIRAMWQSAVALFTVRPDVVLGMGGYITVPGGVMAALLRCPLIIHEQNSVAGLSNRVLNRMAQQTLTGFPDVLPGARWCGNPVRQSLQQVADPVQRYQQRQGPLRLLVVGGSLGAKAINELMPVVMQRFSAQQRPSLLHQTGKNHYESVLQAYRQAGVDATVQPFIEDMGEAYAAADLVICRAGALTVAELGAVGVASILVPYPYAVDDHQTTNGRFLVQHEAALLIQQSELSADVLFAQLQQFSGSEGRRRLQHMAQNARQAVKQDATQQVADICQEYAA